MILATCIENLVPSGERLKSVIFVVTCLSALLMSSCGGQKAIRSTTRCNEKDSVMERVTITSKPVTVPRSRVSLRLNEMQIARLQPGAMFQDKSGQASVTVEKKDSIIVVTAVCDSLQILVERQKTEIYKLRESIEKQETEFQKKNFWRDLKNGAFYILVGMGIMLIIRR